MKLVGGSPDTDRDVVLVSATNIGKRPVRLTSLWLVFGRPFPRWGKAIPKKWRQRYTKGVMQPGDDPMLVEMSATIPVMLGVGEQAVVYSYEETAVLDAAKKHGQTHAYAEAGGSTARGRSNVVKIPLAD